MSKTINSVSGEATVTATTTAKQERYEKKMAKYLANKARKEQKENERIEKDKKHVDAIFNHNLNLMMNILLGRNEKKFVESYLHLFGRLNFKYITSENDLLDAYPDKVKAIFNEKKEVHPINA